MKLSVAVAVAVAASVAAVVAVAAKATAIAIIRRERKEIVKLVHAFRGAAWDSTVSKHQRVCSQAIGSHRGRLLTRPKAVK